MKSLTRSRDYRLPADGGEISAVLMLKARMLIHWPSIILIVGDAVCACVAKRAASPSVVQAINDIGGGYGPYI